MPVEAIRGVEECGRGTERGRAPVDPGRSGLVLVFFIFVAECSFFPRRVFRPRNGTSVKGRIWASQGVHPGAGILGFVKFRSATYGGATEGGRYGGGGGRGRRSYG